MKKPHQTFAFHCSALAALIAILIAAPVTANDVKPQNTTSNQTIALVLESNEQRPWSLAPTLERIAIADPSIVDIIRTGNARQSLLVAKSPGTTTLMLWHRGDTNPQRIRVEVRSAIQNVLQRDSKADVTSFKGQSVVQGGTDVTALDYQAAYHAAQAAAGTAPSVIEAGTVGHSGLVQVEVKVVEFSKSVMRQIGLNFSNTNGSFSYSIGSPGSSGTSALSSAFNLVARSINNDWTANVDLLQANGMARVLAEPTLVALSGQSASFLAGGELPVLEPQGLGSTTINFKPFGIGLTVTPTVLSPQRIALKVAPEASDLDYTRGIAIDGIQVPAITTRRADTMVELGDGETFIIGGLVSNQTSSMVSKIPLLGDIPIIGSFFRNLNQKEEEKELVIVVTPRLVKPLAKNTELTLPGEQQASPRNSVWGSWLVGSAASDPLPGFSR